MSQPKKVEICLHGRFQVRAPGGKVLTPRGSKSQGLLALLAAAEDHERTRRWLQDKLWSERSPGQASSSLRQALFAVRQALGPHADLLVATRQSLRLDPALVSIDVRPAPDAGFLEGINIKDPAFESWLAEWRGSAPAAPLGRVTATIAGSFQIRCLGEAGAPGRALESVLAEMADRTLAEFFGLEAVSDDAHASPDTLLISIQTFSSPDSNGIRALVERPGSPRALWSDTLYGDFDPSDRAIAAFAHRLTDQVVDLAIRSGGDPGAPAVSSLTGLAFRKMFSMRYEEIREAEVLLDLAATDHDRGVLHAWRAQLAAIKFVERQEDDVDALWELAEESCARSMELDPLNSYALSAVANTRLILGHEIAASLELARLGVLRNPGNAYAWWVWSNAKLYSGDTQSAYSAAIAAQRIGDNSRLKFWCDFQRSLTAAMIGKTDEAIRFGEASAALAPNFRPPLRYLAALYANNGQIEDVERNFRKLRRVEPDFTVERYLEDPNYPISMIRRAGLLAPEKFDAVQR